MAGVFSELSAGLLDDPYFKIIFIILIKSALFRTIALNDNNFLF